MQGVESAAIRNAVSDRIHRPARNRSRPWTDTRDAIGELRDCHPVAGVAFRDQPPVVRLQRRIGPTLELGFLSLLFGTAIGVPLGVISAVKQNTLTDQVLRSVAILGISIPFFWIAILTVSLPAFYWGWVPPLGHVSFFDDPVAKRSVTLDYQSEGGAALLRDLVRGSDIVVENGRPGALARHGFGLPELQALNPALVVVSISSFGQTGPYRDRPASEMTLQAASGLMDNNGELGRAPVRYPMNLAQHWAGSNAAFAGLVAYWHATATGQGQLVDVSIQESLANTWWQVWADYQYTGNLQARGQADLLPASDGRVMIMWHTSVPWDEFAIAMDAMELVTDPDLQPPAIAGAGAPRFRETLARHTVERSRRHWLDTALERGLLTGMVQSLDEVAECEQLDARSFWNRTTTPYGRTVAFAGDFYTIDGKARSEEVVLAPSLGEHNREVYGSLGYTNDDLARLTLEGAI